MGVMGQSHVTWGDRSYHGLYLCRETSVLCPDLSAGWGAQPAAIPILKPRY